MTDIHLYNTRTRSKELFQPIDPKDVRMYVCGPTVYDRAHIGNARPVVVFDVLYRLLRHVYGEEAITYARNFTDVDDRIINRAVETKGDDESLEAACRRITDQTIDWYHEDMDALGALRPNVEPRCTEFIPQMVTMTEKLIAEGHAYAAEGHVLFAVDSWRENYGKLSGRSVDDMIAGSRVEVAPYKKNPMDFVLWKPSTPEQPGWDSPWGRGRPGWHIECSAMAQALLGDVFDIHGGGIDLQFPHHENEVAQSCCANHTEVMANVWMHNGFLQVEGEKMAKSLGNFFTVKDLRDRGVPGEVMRFVLLSAHYRQPLDWTEKRIEEITATLQKWRSVTGNAVSSGMVPPGIVDALADDLNTPKAIAELHFLASNGDTEGLAAGASMLGLLTPELGSWTREATIGKEISRTLQELADERRRARLEKDFARADAIRDIFNRAGVEVADTPDGPRLKPKGIVSVEPLAVVAGRQDKFEVYQDKRGEWRWRRKAVNGNIVGAASEGYESRKDAEANMNRGPNPKDTWEFYKDKRGEHRWRRKAVNGNVIGGASEGFWSKDDAALNAARFGYLAAGKEQ